MTADGDFVAAPAKSVWPLRVGLAAGLVALAASGLVLAAIFLWVASILLPVALLAGAIAYAAFRYQVWRARR